MSLKFADTPKGWYQESACSILASLSLVVDANERMNIRGGSLQGLYRHEMEYHFHRAVLDTLRLLQILTHDADFANSGNLADICEKGHAAFNNIIDGNMDGFDLEQE